MQTKVTDGEKASFNESKKPTKSKTKKRNNKKSTKHQSRVSRLELERDQAISKLRELEELLEKLPEIFESKFSQRLAPVLESQRLLITENERLAAQVEQLMAQLNEMALEFRKTSTRSNIAFIGLNSAAASSIRVLSDVQSSEPINKTSQISSLELDVA